MGLRKCLSSTNKFAEYCLPLLQEKLDSDLTSAKMDALHTMVVIKYKLFKIYKAPIAFLLDFNW